MDLTNRFNAMSYCGVGIVTEYAGPEAGFRIGVLNSFNETPAQKAGLRTNDRLLRIETSEGFRTPIDNDEVYNHMRGPQGSRTRIEVLRTGSTTPEIISLTRDMIITRGRN
ncbi:MAG: hypothetical protein C0436_04315, partial [Alphaproteobacteria bacterium]|nr:hypothetical protein [Alphaproteobacteria bacterium]